MESSKYDFDFFVIGGGPGGMSAAKEAAKLKMKVGLADFVTPTPKGTTWGLGGTCVNVGCIPKKMMHYGGLLYDNIDKYKFVGNPNDIKKDFNWETLQENVKMHISSLNFGYRNDIRGKGVTYFNKYAKFVDAHTIELVDKKGKVETKTADIILIATGLRPSYPDCEGAKECCITSDDLFNMKTSPGKTLIIGASYISVECASFLKSYGLDVTMMVRSILLRGFDRDMADRLENELQKAGIKFLSKCIPNKFTKKDEKIIVEYKNTTNNEIMSEEFDTVLLAIGRKADCSLFNIEKSGVLTAKSGKVIVDETEKTNIDNIYAIGDICEGHPELAPPAIQAGKYLARRLFNKENKLMNYNNIATTVYAKLEYGCCGLSEEDAISKFGKENLKIFHSEFTPVEWTIDIDNHDTCYMKVIVNKNDDKVIGFHILAPNAGEITQGISVAMNCGLTKEILDDTVGIHPTIAEEMTVLDITKDEGDGKKSGC